MEDPNKFLAIQAKKLEEFAKTIESTADNLEREKDRLYSGTLQEEKLADLKARSKKAYKLLTKFQEEIKPHIEPMSKAGLNKAIKNVRDLIRYNRSFKDLIEKISKTVPDTQEEIQEKIQEDIIQKIKEDRTDLETLSYFESNIDKINLSTLRKIAIHLKLDNFKKENFKTSSEKIKLVDLLKKHISTLIKKENKEEEEDEGEEDEGEEDEGDEDEDEGEEEEGEGEEEEDEGEDEGEDEEDEGEEEEGEEEEDEEEGEEEEEEDEEEEDDEEDEGEEEEGQNNDISGVEDVIEQYDNSPFKKWIKLISTNKTISLDEYNRKDYFIKIADIKLDTEEFTSGKKQGQKKRNTLIKFIPKQMKDFNKKTEWLYLFLINNRIVKIGGTRNGLKDRVASYLCGHHTLERGKSGSCSKTNAYIYNTFVFYLNLGCKIEMYGYELPKSEITIKIFDQERKITTQTFHAYESIFLQDYKKEYKKYPILSYNCDPKYKE